MAQLLLQQGRVEDALTYFERAAELSRTEGEIVNALSYAEATRTQLQVCILSYVLYTGARALIGIALLPRSLRNIRSSRASSKEAWVPPLGGKRLL